MTNSNISVVGVVGVDGFPPVYDPDARFAVWELGETWTGPSGTGKGRYVPKVRDLVVDVDTNVWYKVVSIEITTLVPRLVKMEPLAQNQQFSNADMLLGVGPGTISDTFRVYLNKSVIPYTLTVDARLHVYTQAAESATIYRGTQIQGTAKIISQLYDQSNQVTGTAVPLQLAQVDGNNRSVKCVPMCYTTEDMPDGEVVTIVFHADDGHVVSKCELLVENTAFVPNAAVSSKYIYSIGLESPFLSQADPSKIQFPLNVPLNGLSLLGVVNYSDGSKVRRPVDQTKFSIFGFNNFISTVPGVPIPLVLSYQLDNTEVAYGMELTPQRTLTKNFTAITTNAEGMYTPKLYGFPVWIDALNGYRLEWWLYDLDRNLATLVTPYVRVNNNSAPWDPVGYGRKQSIGVSINLKDVNPSGLGYIHVQTVDIILRQPGTDRTSNWAIGFDPNQTIFFGEGNHAKTHLVNQNLMTIDVTCGETTLANWLQRLYRMVKPLSDVAKEVQAPDPNYFSICTTTWEVAYPINQWNQVLSLGNTISNSDTVFIKFFQRTPDTDIQLAISAMPVYQQN